MSADQEAPVMSAGPLPGWACIVGMIFAVAVRIVGEPIDGSGFDHLLRFAHAMLMLGLGVSIGRRHA
jgi:hypothetical protein